MFVLLLSTVIGEELQNHPSVNNIGTYSTISTHRKSYTYTIVKQKSLSTSAFQAPRPSDITSAWLDVKIGRAIGAP